MYSQNEEEKYILEYFGIRDIKGTFLSIGENDGITFSNVRALAERGWDGVCIEPAPITFQKLSGLYHFNSLVAPYKLAIGNIDGMISMQASGTLLGKGDTDLVSTIVPKEVKRFENVVHYETIAVDCVRWETFQKLYAQQVAYDFISIDAEGMDWSILQQMQDYCTLDFAFMVCIEWNGDNELAAKYHSILDVKQGMKVIYTSGENLIYAR